MPKIRLNNERREMLQRLANTVVAATPVAPATEKRLKEARQQYKEATTTLHQEAKKVYRKVYTPADLRVLKKHKRLEEEDSLYFVNMDTRNTFVVHLFDASDYAEANLPDGYEDERRLPWEDRQKYYAQLKKTKEKVSVQLSRRMTYGSPEEAPSTLVEAEAAYLAAKDELEMAKGADQDIRNSIHADFHALIQSARTYEDVVEVWPEALSIANEMAQSAHQISLMSTEAVKRIRDNMALRGVEAS